MFATDKKGFPVENVIAAYIQTGDQSNYAGVTGHGYQVISRADLLEIFENENGIEAAKRSDILSNFSCHLRKIEDDVESYLWKPISQWTWAPWIGFYKALQAQLPDSQWQYVANPSGGFVGFYWFTRREYPCKVSLVIETKALGEGRMGNGWLCFKIFVDETSSRSQFRDSWNRLLLEHAVLHGIDVRRPNRFGSGASMTVGYLGHDVRSANEAGILDWDKTLRQLKAVEALLESCLATLPATGQQASGATGIGDDKQVTSDTTYAAI